jgi:hypothetical protein
MRSVLCNPANTNDWQITNFHSEHELLSLTFVNEIIIFLIQTSN